ncbi:MAG: hypothetical protein A2268_15110 [Candidatus Raymondbacteria bacterium RifOxyA12_full_50_37]|nr:MAG: hypothetical protein A2268_15110 [Candidatus Raymondbacteria bacterium RifOxyA12_full_50_37]OGJ88512.1 MAG: hypothetical protein A2248_20150 [Candidatus Raymondbacteria bacterium RIFOXYA2_FULL_49_16]OGJ90605.1 MAG: hypothetical protein A2350_18360 [Candidatus Raymondbacteria bacterium RifOxyB12_full_50_8]OGJ98973.1 MAG: hypothetical protein A2453_10870 [Candidatus Raymondbacteria bacterium RIFOXYC2_FULL_50_21]OGK00611.1 MAG: hypothetical protein A2487_13715 [Candidatus Raymondbacteria b
MNHPDILTGRLRLEPFAEKYLTLKYVGWLNDPAVVKYSEQRHKAHTIETCRSYWEAMQKGGHFFWAVVEPSEGHIGNISAYIDSKNNTADIAIMIGETGLQGKGFGLETWKAVMKFLFKNTDIRKITAGTMSANEPMLRIMRKADMVPDGVRKGQYLLEGQEVDIVYFAAFRQP